MIHGAPPRGESASAGSPRALCDSVGNSPAWRGPDAASPAHVVVVAAAATTTWPRRAGRISTAPRRRPPPRNHKHVPAHWESCLRGFEIPATEPALAGSVNRDCGPEQPLRGGGGGGGCADAPRIGVIIVVSILNNSSSSNSNRNSNSSSNTNSNSNSNTTTTPTTKTVIDAL